ncbi:myb/SANT-like DNA-binding domain-containing protein 3 [Nilaparvata lugens]|uniref:myb/SANT-like DNA-binding domain-containing protein 3 n=1 Tax=Nilaparvata lugens TaxID=108931 RepID=UPI00193E01DD|nr:myb/SANT-like DNA-binding domain-containing protein 3 [Nilaparvata lugens]
MEKSSAKKFREPVFINSEKMLLIDLVEKYYSIIECKKTDGISNKIKQLEWIKIGKEFNSFNTHMERDFNSLKTLWENLKKKAKAVITAMNTNKYATGGGPYRTVKEDQIIERVIPIIKKRAEGFNNIYDSDAVATSTESATSSSSGNSSSTGIAELTTDCELTLEVDCGDEQNYTVQDSSPIPTMMLVNGDWESYSPGLLRTPRAKVLVDEASHSPIASTSALPKPTITPEEEKGVIQRSTPISKIRTTRHLHNRRRPVLKESEAIALASCKIKNLQVAEEQARKEHEVTMECLLMQKEQEREKLVQEQEKTKQEREKTEQEVIKKMLLLAELERLKK